MSRPTFRERVQSARAKLDEIVVELAALEEHASVAGLTGWEQIARTLARELAETKVERSELEKALARTREELASTALERDVAVAAFADASSRVTRPDPESAQRSAALEPRCGGTKMLASVVDDDRAQTCPGCADCRGRS